MVQRSRMCLAMQETLVGSLVPEDPTCCRATKPMLHTAEPAHHTAEPAHHTAEPALHTAEPAHHTAEPVLEGLGVTTTKPTHCIYRSLCSATRESTSVRSSGTTVKSSPHSPQLEKDLYSNEDPAQPKTKINKSF